jgi:hypothetical protein
MLDISLPIVQNRLQDPYIAQTVASRCCYSVGFNPPGAVRREPLRYLGLTFSLDAGLRACTLVSTHLMPGNIYPIASFSGFLACAGRLFYRTINT